MFLAHHPLRSLRRSLSTRPPVFFHSATPALRGTDPYGIPLEPTWSVNKLLSSYPTPSLSSETLIRLHELSALIPPAEGTPEHATLKQEMEDLIRLVEAVKLVDTGNVNTKNFSFEGTDRQESAQHIESAGQEVHGTKLLDFASRTSEGFYVVETDRQR